MKNNILDVNKLVLALAEYPEAEDDIVGMYVKGDALSGMISQRCSPNYCRPYSTVYQAIYSEKERMKAKYLAVAKQTLGIISRMAGKTHTAKYIWYYEDAVALGGVLGNLFSIYQFSIPAGTAGLVLYGLFAGIYTGAWSMALTEIVDVIPIFSRRIGLKAGMPWLILSMALGRLFGGLIYYGCGF